MDATSFCSSSSSCLSTLHYRKPLSRCHKKHPRGHLVVAAAGRDFHRQWNHSGQLVNESLIVLRKRIHDMKMVERNYEPPADWSVWEKQYYTSYNELICKMVGLLQSQLMNMKPSLALGVLALVTMSLQASSIMVFVYLMQAANGMLSAIHFY